MLELDSSTPNDHRSMVAVKEYGILMASNSTGLDNSPAEQFWVIGLVWFNLLVIYV